MVMTRPRHGPEGPEPGELDESSTHTDATGFWLPEERRRVGDGPPIDEPWDDPTKALDTAARPYPREVAPEADFEERMPTRAFTPDEPPTSQVDLGQLDGAGPVAPLPEDPPPADPYYAPAEADEYRGWGPQVPDEMVKTTFFDRGGASDDPDRWKEPAVDTAPALRKPPERKPGPSMLTRTFVAPTGGVRRGRAIVIGALCIAGGVIIGTAIGLGASDGEPASSEVRAEPVAERRVAAPEAAREPEPAPEPVAEPQPVAEPEPVAEAQPVAVPPPVAAPEPVAEPVAEAQPAPEPPAPEADPLGDAALALREGDAEALGDALERARAQGAGAAAVARIEADLAVLRGDGAAAVERLRELARAHGEAALHVALGRVLVQAERDREANDAFRAALELDASDVDALLGISGVHARAARIGAARRHHRQAVDAAGARASADRLLGARIRAADALILLENGDMSGALREAEAARRLDDRSSEAALVLARVALLRSQPADAHLRSAVEGRAPAPMALALLAQAVQGNEACELASRYLERAPQGFDAPAMRRIRQRCR
ncbi:MAG: hypothetical protein M5U28_30150 [Sandaracinaceae bacterium]|nr:hypothetical protein [Sandaracinaceae bacterium]